MIYHNDICQSVGTFAPELDWIVCMWCRVPSQIWHHWMNWLRRLYDMKSTFVFCVLLHFPQHLWLSHMLLRFIYIYVYTVYIYRFCLNEWFHFDTASFLEGSVPVMQQQMQLLPQCQHLFPVFHDFHWRFSLPHCPVNRTSIRRVDRNFQGLQHGNYPMQQGDLAAVSKPTRKLNLPAFLLLSWVFGL